ncbi:GD19008 [Drosophila simulans]|uniref:GD19008 n=1 Tax=Drosophila simulans TaxID=7240 RepID=B4QYJ9_DROSI|nr:GD19008 [Drosophila simulans]
MKFFAILFLLCAIVGFAASSSSTTTTEASFDASTTSAAPSPVPCGNGPQGPCGKKLYFFY